MKIFFAQIRWRKNFIINCENIGVIKEIFFTLPFNESDESSHFSLINYQHRFWFLHSRATHTHSSNSSWNVNHHWSRCWILAKVGQRSSIFSLVCLCRVFHCSSIERKFYEISSNSIVHGHFPFHLLFHQLDDSSICVLFGYSWFFSSFSSWWFPFIGLR